MDLKTDEKFNLLRAALAAYQVDARDLFPLAIPQMEALAMHQRACSDQPAPRPGDEFDYMGVPCICVSDGRQD